jgi:hypothetical protein
MHSGNRTWSEIFALLRCYATKIGSYLPTFKDNLSVPFSRSVTIYQSAPPIITEERISHLRRYGSVESRIELGLLRRQNVYLLR